MHMIFQTFVTKLVNYRKSYISRTSTKHVPATGSPLLYDLNIPLLLDQRISDVNILRYGRAAHQGLSWIMIMTYLDQSNMFAANPRFARGESRISFDMLKSLRNVLFFYFPKQQTLKP